ncbi:MAG: hypothetical protein IPH18_14995 [Chitinophagaceae bacterium]|nr:hypothetical protein [Chitinophagaceae bacterium]
MRYLTLLLFILVVSCKQKKTPVNLEEAFLQSVKDADFNLLKKYLPDAAFYKSLGKDVKARTDAEIDSFLKASSDKLKGNWETIRKNMASKNADAGKIQLHDAVIFSPYSQSVMQGMVLVYGYEGKEYDDITLMVKKQGEKTYLLEITNPLAALQMKDTSLASSSQAKAANELQTPAFTELVKKKVEELLSYASENNVQLFGNSVIYRGNDDARSWKAAINMNNAEEKIIAEGLFKEVKSVMTDCSGFTFGTVAGEKESEGYWIVQPVVCGKKIVRFAFLKVKDKLLLGDFDVEQL